MSQGSKSSSIHSLLIVLQLCISFLAAFLAMRELFLSSNHHLENCCPLNDCIMSQTDENPNLSGQKWSINGPNYPDCDCLSDL